MKNKLILLILSVTLSSCGTGTSVISTKAGNAKTNFLSVSKPQPADPKTLLKGKVDFGSSFKIKANIDPGEQVIVSLLHIPYQGAKDMTTALSGVTNPDGSFVLSPANNAAINDFGDGLILNYGEVYILEAMKRISSQASEIITLRTYVRWSENGWESITTPSLVINAFTTAVTIITSNNSGNLIPYYTIGLIDNSTQPPIINPYGILTSETVNQVNDTVNKALNDNVDPVAVINFNPIDNIYYISNSVNIGKLNSNLDCNGCDKNNLSDLKYSGQEKEGWEMMDKNLSKSDL